jgi:single-strand DNA-binding protein
MNKVVLMGRLTRDPNVRYSQNEKQTAVARMTIAVDRRFKRDGEPDADFIGCVAFGRQAEFAEKYLRKGVKVVVSGRITTGRYTDRDGKTVFTTDVVLEDIEFAESKTVSDRNSGSYSAPQFDGAPAGDSRPQPAPQTGGNPFDEDDGFMNIPESLDDSLPFS